MQFAEEGEMATGQLVVHQMHLVDLKTLIRHDPNVFVVKLPVDDRRVVIPMEHSVADGVRISLIPVEALDFIGRA